jgi:hypothetical protein
VTALERKMIEKRKFLTVEVTDKQRGALSDAAHKARTNMSDLVRQSVAATLSEIEPAAAELWNTKSKAV